MDKYVTRTGSRGGCSNPMHKQVIDELKQEVKELKEDNDYWEEEVKTVEKKHKRFVQAAKDMFGEEGRKKIEDYLKTESDFDSLLWREGELKSTLEKLKGSLPEVSKRVRDRVEEVRKLNRRLAILTGENRRNRMVWDGQKEGQSDGHPGQVIVGRKTAETILPEEIWKMILGQVSDPKDLWNCTNTCQLFEDLLRQWKTEWMMEQTLPHLYRSLPRAPLLKCRSISQGWKRAVDGFLDNHPSLRPHSDEYNPRRLDFLCPLKESQIGTGNHFTFSFNQGDEWNLRGLRMQGCEKPFVGRYVTLSLSLGYESNLENEDGKDPWGHLYQFLETYGEEIWYLHVKCLRLPTGELTIRKLAEFVTVRLAQFLPNLKKLCIGNNNNNNRLSTAFGVGDGPELIPAIPKLETIWAPHCTGGGALEAIIRRHHGQLHKLTVSPGIWRRLSGLDWSSLTELHLNFWEWHTVSVDLVDLPELTLPNLSKLVLSLPPLWDRPLTYEQLLGAINELEPRTRLNTLRLEGAISILEPEPGAVKPNCAPTNPSRPSVLKNFEIVLEPWGWKPAPSFNFLLWCFPRLEKLTVMIREKSQSGNYIPEMKLASWKDIGWSAIFHRHKNEELIDLGKYAFRGGKGMYKSNIWMMLPHLKVFSFQSTVYTRQGYEEFLRYRCETSRK